ncbi:MAG: exodeoxyribonuclease V subunit gamma, partial [Pseudomonadota bacterium]|nr:exodeoxyribonuclease V subunit gamma [Pseudomonadota bacterium]
PATPLRPEDRSVQIHACHSPLRELEVLHDQLLALFQADSTLQPADVVVMTPDIDAYAPIIEAVFATADPPRRIPYAIADRGVRSESILADAFFRLLDLAASRFDANQVLAVLATAAVQRAFALSDADLALVQHWVRETAIRWGIDPAARAALDLPATREHTWRAGLDRLLAGYALPGRNSRLFADILSYDDLEGGDAQTMGRLQSFAEAAFALATDLAGRRTVAQWVGLAHGLLERFFAPDGGEEAEAQRLRDALQSLAGAVHQAGFEEAVSLEVFRAALRRHLESPEGAGRFLTGGVTFCAMVPMRSIPAKVVCLIGMNYSGFPRPHRPPGFDLMARDARKGDRSRRNDDRYLFLEAILSARHGLYISYVGSNIRDNSPIPPSVLVSELLDTLRQGFYPQGDDKGNVLDHLVIRHPLQAFSRRYFTGDGPLFSYSPALCEASRLAGRGEAEPLPLIRSGLSEPDGEWRTVDLDRLIRFFANPARFLLRQRLGLHLEEGQGTLETREPFTLDYLPVQRLRRDLLALHLAAEPAEVMLPLVRAAGILPHGRVGDVLFQRERHGVERFAQRLQALRPAALLEPLEVDIPFQGLRLVGRLNDVSPQGLLSYRLDEVRAKDYLNLWLRHLVLNCLKPPGVAPVSRWLGDDKGFALRPVADPRGCLQVLLDIYWQGLRRPLHFLPKSALVYAKAALGSGRSDPMAAARKKWEGSEEHPGECQDLYYQLAFRGSDPLDGEFAALAMAVFRPVFEHEEGE